MIESGKGIDIKAKAFVHKTSKESGGNEKAYLNTISQKEIYSKCNATI
jgi:hypothetical protein